METYIPKGICSTKIDFEVDENNKLRSVSYEKGCNGNLKGLSKLVEGMDVDDVIERLNGIKCGNKSTSCPDQLSKALVEWKKKI